MENYLNLDYSYNLTIYNKIKNKVVNDKLTSKELNNKYINSLGILKQIYNNYFNKHSNVTLSAPEDKLYELIFINIIDFYKKKYKKKPHIISNNNITLLTKLETNNLINLSIIKPNISGKIICNDIIKLLRKNTCFISINYTNNTIGSINDIDNIKKLCISKNILFHVDISDIFLDSIINIDNINLITVSYKKYTLKLFTILYSNSILEYLANDNIFITLKKIEDKGTPNNLNNILILNLLLSYKLKNLKSFQLKNYNNKSYFINKLKEYINIISYDEYLTNKNLNNFSIIYFDYLSNQSNILTLSIYINNIKFSNKIFKKNLIQFGINILPIYNSNDISFLKNDLILYNGILYFNFNESIKNTDLNLLIKGVLKTLQMQIPNLFNNILNNTSKTKNSIKSINKIKKRVRFSTPEYTIFSKKKNLPKNNKIPKGILITN